MRPGDTKGFVIILKSQATFINFIMFIIEFLYLLACLIDPFD